MPNASFINDTNVLAQNPFMNSATKIMNVYSDAVRQNMEGLIVSSAKIIQSETIRAWTSAAQSCSKALAENAMSSQQQALERIIEANKEVFGIFGMDLSPFKMQPMAGVADWLPTAAKRPSSKPGKVDKVRNAKSSSLKRQRH